MTKRADQFARIEAMLGEIRTALASLADRQRQGEGRLDGLGESIADLAGVVQQVLAARAEHDSAVAADAKAARSAAESAFVATQALAADAVRRPGPGELAAAVAENTELTRAVHGLTAQVHQLIEQAAQTPDDGLAGVLEEVRALRALVTPAEPALQAPAPGVAEAGTATRKPPGGMGSRIPPKTPRDPGGRM
jgi:hypothetical protein